MSIFGKIMSAIFGTKAEAAPAGGAATGGAATGGTAAGGSAATVDVAYTGVNSAIKVVDQIKSKLVAARQPGVDRGKIQSEITELQSQLRGIADSASFSGENWLSVDSADPGYNAIKTIVSSFARSGGAVTIGTISINLGNLKLFDVANQSGILDTQSTTTNGPQSIAAKVTSASGTVRAKA